MLTSLSVAAAFPSVPYLPSSSLMKRHGGTLTFSTEKSNVIVGPNGAGKSALLNTLALRFLASQTGESALDGRYMSDRENEVLWSKASRWGDDWAFMAGLTVETDNAPARYYRPGHIPGNECGVTHAMMLGYMDEAKAFARLTEHKSSGQKRLALLDAVMPLLAGKDLPKQYALRNWSGGREPRNLDRSQHNMPWDYQKEVLRALFGPINGGVPLVLMDEPEQSLDALAEVRLWKALAGVDCTGLQVIVATHSLYPLLNPDAFNIIEAVDGYVDEVRALAKA